MYDMDIFGIVVDIFINSIVKCMWLYGVFLEIILCVLLYKENMGKWICCFGLLYCYFFMFIEDNGIFLY